ncbi:MAG: dihydropteroate synthase [Dehalococcoidia bacterium]|nr:MAG: dihydropteroate synthase [Dehalococcoidia bacterium]
MEEPMAHKNLHLDATQCGNTEFRWGERTYIMGIINMSRDSFSGDGFGSNIDKAIEQAKQFIAEGADIIDIGGESTRPGSQPISPDDEIGRVVPIIEKLTAEINAPISIDTGKSAVAICALQAGANMINDVWGMKLDNRLIGVASEAGVPLIITSNQRGQSCQQDIIKEVTIDLKRNINIAEKAGVKNRNIIIDPGIGFGKTLEQNLEIIRRLAELKSLNKPILLGTSRKSMIGLVLDLPADRRLEGTAATVAIGIANGADIIRVHDVRQMALVSRMSDAIIRRTKGEY